MSQTRIRGCETWVINQLWKLWWWGYHKLWYPHHLFSGLCKHEVI